MRSRYASPAERLPIEILAVGVFEPLVACINKRRRDTYAALDTLRAARLVCRAWRHAANLALRRLAVFEPSDARGLTFLPRGGNAKSANSVQLCLDGVREVSLIRRNFPSGHPSRPSSLTLRPRRRGCRLAACVTHGGARGVSDSRAGAELTAKPRLGGATCGTGAPRSRAPN